MVMMTSQRRVQMRWWNLFNHFIFKGFTLLKPLVNLFKLSLTYLASFKRWLYLYYRCKSALSMGLVSCLVTMNNMCEKNKNQPKVDVYSEPKKKPIINIR